ncbi:hypothetical protein ACTJJB_02855 [Chitinophaga sp. 22536]|uniref:hypothetical protein n=1 Tax=unclassified Chitinophaga TaxID=2619133 RepID=UPI003F8645B7
MKKYFIYLMPVCMTMACADRNDQQGKTDTTTATVNAAPPAAGTAEAKTDANNIPGATPAWADSLIMAYAKETSNELIKFAVKDSSFTWILDNTEKTDSAEYMIIHLGHHVEEEDHSNPRFVTDGWLYINTATRKLYEYDVPADTLIPWHRK